MVTHRKCTGSAVSLLNITSSWGAQMERGHLNIPLWLSFPCNYSIPPSLCVSSSIICFVWRASLTWLETFCTKLASNHISMTLRPCLWWLGIRLLYGNDISCRFRAFCSWFSYSGGKNLSDMPADSCTFPHLHTRNALSINQPSVGCFFNGLVIACSGS